MCCYQTGILAVHAPKSIVSKTIATCFSIVIPEILHQQSLVHTRNFPTRLSSSLLCRRTKKLDASGLQWWFPNCNQHHLPVRNWKQRKASELCKRFYWISAKHDHSWSISLLQRGYLVKRNWYSYWFKNPKANHYIQESSSWYKWWCNNPWDNCKSHRRTSDWACLLCNFVPVEFH